MKYKAESEKAKHIQIMLPPASLKKLEEIKKGYGDMSRSMALRNIIDEVYQRNVQSDTASAIVPQEP